MDGFIKELGWRGLVHQISSPKLVSLDKTSIYAGFDPTADSLHIGHLLPLLALRRAELHGHKPIALIGGATGLIGDPSGRSAERNLLSRQVIQHNVDAITLQIKKLIPNVVVVNNADWFNGLNVLDFFREVGTSFSVSAMLARDAVKNRIESESGISFTEFAYMIFQAFDFLHLSKEFDCKLQIGGSDQFGNIASGIDLIRRAGHEAFGITMPLITNSSGEKFGKTAKGAVWLDPAKTSAHDMFQFFFNTSDDDVIKFLKFFTFFDKDKINELVILTKESPEKRKAQKELANSVCNFVHDMDGDDIPVFKVSVGSSIVDILFDTKLCSSKGDARTQLKQSSVRLNDQVINNIHRILTADDFSAGNVLLTKGKKGRCFLRL